MTSYDSDSSLDDVNDRSTNVTLGYASTEPTGDEISHIGGRPSWLNSKSLPSGSLAKCRTCNDYMALLLQLHADSQQYFPNDERRLFVWCCRKKACSRKPGSIRSFRETKKGKQVKEQSKRQESEEQEHPEQNIGSLIFGGSTPAGSQGKLNPFQSDTSLNLNGNPFANTSSLAAKTPQAPNSDVTPQALSNSFADKLKIGISKEEKEEASKHKSEPWPDEAAFPKPFPSLFLDAETEYLDPEPPGPSKTQLQPSFETENDKEGSDRDIADTFESTLDRIFLKFSDIIAQNPEQVLRYELKGQPLLYTGSDNIATYFVLPHGKTGPVKGIPRCEYCGATRVFELQLVPGLIYEVEKDDETIGLDEGMEWGTIIVGTCEKNCGEEDKVVFREEWTGVQWEERTPAIKKG